MNLKIDFLDRWVLILTLLVFSCSDGDDPGPAPQTGTLVEAASRGSWPAANLKLFVQLSGQDIDPELITYDVEIFQVTYRTTYREKEIHASGLVLLPKTTGPVPMISYHRGTTVRQADAPSARPINGEEVLSFSALTSMGFITAVPDLIGFGSSAEIFHPYYVEGPTTAAVTDMLHAASELAKQESIAFDERLFLAGYSQGGYITMAAHKALETKPVDGFDVIASFPAAGGYHLNALLDELRPAPTYPDPYYLAYIALSYQSYYEKADLVSAFFNEPYASQIPGLFDGIMSGSEINSELTQDLATLVREEILNADENYPTNQFLENAFSDNSPIDWTPSAPIFMYHGDADEVVPVENSQQTYDRLLSNGASADKLQLIIFPGHDHGSAVVPYIEDVVNKLSKLK